MPEYVTPDLMIRGGLVDPKHWLAMGEAVWLYLYLQRIVQFTGEDAGKTFPGHLYQHRDAVEAIGAPRRRIERWFAQLVDAGYLTVTRRRLGYEVTITKYEDLQKRAASRRARPATSGASKPVEIRQNAHSDTPKAVARPATSGASIYGSQESKRIQEEGDARAAVPPPHLADFDRALRGFAEYHPTTDYYALVDRYLGQIRELSPDFDLAAERVKLVDHHQRKGGGIGIGNVLTWLDVALKRAKEDAAKHPASKPMSRRTFTPPSGQRTSPPAELRARLARNAQHAPPIQPTPHGDIA